MGEGPAWNRGRGKPNARPISDSVPDRGRHGRRLPVEPQAVREQPAPPVLQADFERFGNHPRRTSASYRPDTAAHAGARCRSAEGHRAVTLAETGLERARRAGEG